MSEGGLIDVAKLASRLKASKSWVYGACEVGVRRNGSFVHLPHFRVGKHLRFDLEEVLAFLKSDGEG